MDVFGQAGVIFNYGKDVTKELLADLENRFDAVYFAVGLQKPSDARIEGENIPEVKPAFDFLMKSTDRGEKLTGKKVIVIGGGNVAMDTARTCVRLGADVVLSYRRRIEDMPADDEEIHEAMEETIDFRPKTIPIRIERTESGIRYLYHEAKMVDNPKGGRPLPKPKGDVEHVIDADILFSAIGQTSDIEFIPESMQKEMKLKWGRIIVDDNQYTGYKNFFAGGDT